MGKQILSVFAYGDIDLNLIDGSSIWLISLLEVLLLDPNIRLTVLLKRPIIRTLLLEPYINEAKVKLIDPWSTSPTGNEAWYKRKRLLPEEASLLMEELNKDGPYDIFLVRGLSISKAMAKNKELALKTWAYITDFPQNQNDLTEDQRNELRMVYQKVKYILCQTTQLEHYFKQIVGGQESKFILLPPMIPDYGLQKVNFKNSSNRLVYVGKFAPLWNTQEAIDAFKKIKSSHLTIEFHVAGDKFNIDPTNPEFEKEVKNKLENTEGVVWHKGKTRDEVEKLIEKCDLGVSWRHSALNDSLEISTKLLEYGGLGKPVILNRNVIHEELLGRDYPFYADSEQEFIEQVEKALDNPELYEKAAQTLYHLCKKFTFSEVYQQLSTYLWKDRMHKRQTLSESTIKILFNGHDLKFAQILIDYFKELEGYEVRIDLWKGHNKNDENQSRECLSWAQIIICEWGLGNAVWYSRNKRDNQVLFIRMHRQELETHYPEEFKLENINQIIAISPHISKAFKERFGFPENKMTIIYNLIDSGKLMTQKKEGSLYNLGLLGYCPRLKRLDRALDILEELWKKDQRYVLYIKGKSPEEYGWLWKREKEREYYEAVQQRIEQSVWKKAVIFEPWSSNIEDWFAKIGFILSVSDYESFHLAAAEGMAAGSLPVILERAGANGLYPQEFIFHSESDAAAWIGAAVKNKDIKELKDFVQKFAQGRYDKEFIGPQWKSLIEQELSKLKIITMQRDEFSWPDHQVVMLEFYRKFDSSKCMNRLKDMFSSPLNKDYLLAAEDIIKNRLYSIPPYGVVQFENPIDWQGDSSQNRSFMRLLHGHFFIRDLIEAFKQTKNSLYLHEGYEIIEDWISKNPFGNAVNPMAWHDETTARRLINWITFFDEARKILSQESLVYLLDHIKKHAELLSTDGFYSKNTNHGMFQDQALIVYSDYFSSIEGSKGLKMLACSRLKEYFEEIFSPEGVHLEHSPGYHELIAHKLLMYSHYFNDQDDPLGHYLFDKYHQAANFATHIIKPDGFLPQIGDTLGIKPSQKLWRENPGYRYAATGGREGEPPEETDMVFPEAGYAVFRDSWTQKEWGTYVLFMAAYHTNYHKHSDDLSLWICARGGDIIVESGPYGYNYQDQLTQYSYSSFAHNVLLVDNEGLPRIDGKYSAVKIVDYRINIHKSSVTGVNERYKDVKHTRTLEYNKLNQIIKVTDKISSDVEHEYKLLWHLAPDIEAMVNGQEHIVLNRKNACVMEIIVKGSIEVSLSRVRGQIEPLVMGWYCKKFGEKEPINTLVFKCKGKDAIVSTEFILNCRKGSQAEEDDQMSTEGRVWGENSTPLNALYPLIIPTYDGSGEAVHPSVLYFPNKWNGYYYWMAFTPYKKTNEKYENPSIVVSNDGNRWAQPEGLINPIVPKPADGHLGDLNLCFINNRLFMFYRKRYRLEKGMDYEEIFAMHSQDGINWSRPQSILVGDNKRASQLLSPEMVMHLNQYYLYTINNQRKCIQRRVSDDPEGKWSNPEDILLKNLPDNVFPWHINVVKYQDYFEFIIVMMDKKRTEPNTLYYGRSDEGKVILLNDKPILYPSKIGWDNEILYQGSLVPIVKSNECADYLYYSARGKNKVWNIGKTIINPKNLDNNFKNNRVLERVIQLIAADSYLSNENELHYYMEERYVKEEVINLADHVLKHQWKVAKGHEFVTIDIKNFDWAQYPLNNNTWKFRLHSLAVVEQLVQAYEYTKDIRYLNHCQEIILSWHRCNPISEWKTKGWAYYDQGTAFRVIYLVEFWKNYRKLATVSDKEFISELLLIFYEHAELLMNKEFYEEKDNHGMYQDIALMSIALALPEFDEAEKWFILGQQRLKKQVLETVSEAGVHLEHSPQYQVVVYNLLFKAMQWLHKNNLPVDPDIEAIIRKMPLFISYIIKPNKTFPLFGNTLASTITPDLFFNINEYDSLKYILSNGQGGSRPADLINEFYPSGYGVLRSFWNNTGQSFEESVYFAITAGFNSKVHKHPDDLSFELFAFGKDIIVDTGKYSYTPGLEREYALSTKAHNVVLVDNREYDLSVKNIGRSGILHYEEGVVQQEYVMIKAYHELYDSVRHERQVFYDHEQTFIIIDDLYSESFHLYTQLFHLGAGLRIKETGATTIVEDPDTHLQLIVIQLNSVNLIEYLDPQVGFTSKANYKKEKNVILQYNLRGNNIRFITLLHLSKDEDERLNPEKITELCNMISTKIRND